MKTTLEVFKEVMAQGPQILVDMKCIDIYSIVTKIVYNLDCEANQVKLKYPLLRKDVKLSIYAKVYSA